MWIGRSHVLQPAAVIALEQVAQHGAACRLIGVPMKRARLSDARTAPSVSIRRHHLADLRSRGQVVQDRRRPPLSRPAIGNLLPREVRVRSSLNGTAPG